MANNLFNTEKLPTRFEPIPIEIREIFDSQRSTYEYAIKRIGTIILPHRPIEFYADFLDGGICQAKASIYDSVGMIGIYKGAIMLPLDLFLRFFTHPDVLPTIGDCSNELRDSLHREGIPEDYDTLIESRRRAGRDVLARCPVDPIRRAVVMACAECVWDFLFLHEIFHIAHGHIEYINSRKYGTPMPLIPVFAAQGLNGLSLKDLDYQALELWADSKAVTITLGRFLKNRVGGGIDELFPDPKQKLFLWAFAIYALFRIWGIKIDLKKMGGTHPPSAMRFEIAMISAKMDVDLYRSDLASDFLTAIHQAQIAVEHAIGLCGGDKLLASSIIGIKDPAATDRRQKLLEHFDSTLLPQLKIYSHVEMKSPSVQEVREALWS